MAGLRLVTERTGDGVGQPILDGDNGEELIHVQPGVSIALGNRSPESSGTLYMTSKQVVWLSETDRGKGYAVDFYSVSLHAVSRDPDAYPSPCIYTQIDNGTEDAEMEDSDEDGDGTLNLSSITEMRLIPSDPNQLDTMFDVFCDCAELNPDPVEEEEVEHNWVFSADQFQDEAREYDHESEWDLHPNPTHSIGASGNHDLARSVFQLQINDPRFEDADETDHDDENGHQHDSIFVNYYYLCQIGHVAYVSCSMKLLILVSVV